MAAPQGVFYRLFGKKLSQIRHAKRITQAVLASSVGLSRTSITNIERGRQPVQLHVAARIAEALSTSVATLLPERRTVDESKTAAKLRRLRPATREWVERVIAGQGYEEVKEDGSKILSSKEEGGGTVGGGQSKTTSGAG